MLKKELAFIIVFLLISAGVVSGFNVNPDNIPKPMNRGNWLYVGGTGEGNYSSIQSAINDADHGDTVFVYNGTYNERIDIIKMINLIGEDKNTTIIDGSNLNGLPLIEIFGESVTVIGFTLQNFNNYTAILIDGSFGGANNNSILNNIIHSSGIYSQGIEVFSCNNTILGNIISEVNYGIRLTGGSNNKIIGNDISYTYYGIFIEEIFSLVNNNTYSNNNIVNNTYGIFFWYTSYDNIISNNTICLNEKTGIYSNTCNSLISDNMICSNNECGINFTGDHICNNNVIRSNIISLNNLGIYINIFSSGNIIYNNFFNNTLNAYNKKSSRGINKWCIEKTPGLNIIGGPYLGGNYWSDYFGRDWNEDGIGESKIPWTCLGNITPSRSGDIYPLYKKTGIIYPNITYVDDDYNNATSGWSYDHFNNIQEGIDSVAINGTVYVYNGTYNETVAVDIPVKLIGEDRNTTFVKSLPTNTYTMDITADWVNISGFNFENNETSQNQAIIFSYYQNFNPQDLPFFIKNIFIIGNTFKNNSVGIRCEKCSDILIKENILIGCQGGIVILHGATHNISIKSNFFDFHAGFSTGGFGYGIYISLVGYPEAHDINITGNTITRYFPNGGEAGICLYIYYTSYNITLYNNDITNCYTAVYTVFIEQPNSTGFTMVDGNSLIVKQNNFKRNLLYAKRGFRGNDGNVLWQNNYWGRPRLFPKLIVVLRMITENLGLPSRLEFDWHPAKKPYDIPRIAI